MTFTNYIHTIVQVFADLVGVAAAVLIMAGIVHGLILAVGLLRKHHSGEFDCVRLVVGQYLLLGLEFLIGKDILETIVEPSFTDLGALVVLIVIRVLLNYFLILDLDGKHDFMAIFNKIGKTSRKKS